MEQPEGSLADLLNELQLLVNESEAYQPPGKIKEALAEVGNRLEQLWRRVVVPGRRYPVALAGLTNVGKSTLVNAIVGAEVAPRYNGPCTSVAVEFYKGNRYTVAVRTGQVIAARYPCESSEKVRDRLQMFASEQGGGVRTATKYIQVELPIFPDGLLLADTPGFGAVEDSSSPGGHEEALKSYLTQEVAQAFWVVRAEAGIGQREFSFYEKFLFEKCNDVIVTGCEGWDATDRLRFQQRFEGALRQPLLRFHFVSGMQGCEGRKLGDLQLLQQSGVPTLLTEMSKQANPQARLKAIEEDLVSLANQFGQWWRQMTFGQSHAGNRLWRPDSLDRWRRANCAPELKAIVNSML